MYFKVLEATIKKNLCIQLRAYPKSFFIGNLLTGVYTILGAWFVYGILFEKKVSADFTLYTGTKDYMSFTIIGSLVYLFVVRTCLNVSRTLITELREGTLESLMLAPFRRAEYFIGNMLLQTITTSLEIGVSFLMALPFGLNMSQMNGIGFVVALLVALYGFFGVSMVLGCLMLYTRDTYISQNTLFLLLFLICGITFPIEYLPQWLQGMSTLIPITQGVKLIRETTLMGMNIGEALPLIGYTFLLSSIYIVVGFLGMRKTEKIALEKIEG